MTTADSPAPSRTWPSPGWDKKKTRSFGRSTQILGEREGYYERLESTRRGRMNIIASLVWLLTQVEAACTDAHNIIANTPGKTRFWQRHHQTVFN